MQTRHILFLCAVLIIVSGGVYLATTNGGSEKIVPPIAKTLGDPQAVSSEQTTAVPVVTTQTKTLTNTVTTTTAKNVTVIYGANGFSPASVTIKKGDTVTFVATSGSGRMWVASDQHPSHQGYSGTSKSEHCVAGYSPAPFDQCTNDTSFSFTFGKTGTWGYHNHSNAGDSGVVVVQ